MSCLVLGYLSCLVIVSGYQNGTSVRKINQFGDYDQTDNMSVEDWEYRWGKNQTQFHMNKVHPLASQGYEVIGCDCADKGCKEFFEENEIPYETSPIKGIDGTIYRATNDKKITLYKCDYFALNEYSKITTAMMKENSTYLLDCFLVDNDRFGGPPFNCTEKNVTSAFGSKWEVEKLETKDVFSKWQESWNIDSFFEEVYLLTKKS
ncbi:hypothetical protein KUTeg_016143 [Tegillarca granosa]|uniref:Uncharacterized protein n=1 Tax=Tegillarca granosa TaxID=220873 RepID=A0ABQ9EK06_TEGGR|nr:hypothetical protein KUTeg_016143 [Tegillarca granosa]